MNIENRSLFERKKKELLFGQPQNECNGFIDLNFYGVPISISSSNVHFLNKLSTFYPSSWQALWHSDPITLNFHPVSESFNSLEDFEDESNSDCYVFIKDGTQYAIQRDFAGKTSDEIAFDIYCELELSDGFFNALRWILPRYLIKKNKFLLHSSCVVENDKAYVFLGYSGHGKTTTAISSSPRLVLGDDMNVISLEGNRILAYPGAFDGSIYDPNFDQGYQVAGFFWLNKDNKIVKIPLSFSDAMAKLSASACNLFWGVESREFIQEVMELSFNVVERSSFYKLHLQKNDKFWPVIAA